MTYSEYKDSGIDWIGKIPAGWEVKKTSHATEKIGSGTTPKSDNSEFYENGTIPWLQTGDLNDGEIFDVKVHVTQRAIEQYSSLCLYPEDSVSIALYGATIGKLGILKIPTTVNQANCVMIFDSMNVPKYWFYAFIMCRPHLISLACGGGQPNISKDIISSTKLSCPPLKEQQEIVDYLDYKTQQIDSFIEKTNEKIEILKEQRTATINQVVTKGLDSDAEMKDSEVDWIGEIPVGWEVKKLKFTSKAIPSNIDKNIDPDELQIRLCNYTDVYYNEFISSSLDLSRGSCKQSEYDKLQLLEGDVILTKDSETADDIGVPAFVTQDFDDVVCGYHLTVVRPLEILGKFLFRFIQYHGTRKYFEVNSEGITRWGLGKPAIENLIVPFPPLQEQQEIVDYLDHKTQQIDSQVERELQRIELLKEYRNSLISEVVTGQIDVRGELVA